MASTTSATANIIAWERCKPIFVDIDPDTWNIDPDKIEDKITQKTSAILPVHVFSAPCDVKRIELIASKHNLRVIYDAAHAMAVNCGGKSIMSYGNVSCTSFHATKLFNTCEGGACITNDEEVGARIRRMRFFGFNEQKDIVDDGMNAKMTEVTAALGLANLRHLDRVRKNRREKYHLYQSMLADCSYIRFQKFDPDEYNYSYMPVHFNDEEILLRAIEKLNEESVFPKRYFYPSLHEAPVFNNVSINISLPISESVARRTLCLPLYDKLDTKNIERISKVLLTC